MLKAPTCLKRELNPEDIESIEIVEKRINDITKGGRECSDKAFLAAFNVTKRFLNKLRAPDQNNDRVTIKNPRLVLLVTVLHLLKPVLSNGGSFIKMKYASVHEFMEKYPGFDGRALDERNALMCAGNWMKILFSIIAARNNKGLAMAVVKKFAGMLNMI